MRVLFFVLNNSDLLQPLLVEFDKSDIHGCTILESNGMGRELSKKGDVFKVMFGSLRNLLTPDLRENKTLMLAISDEKLEVAIKAIEAVVGDLNEPNTGIAFSFPLDFVKGAKL